MRIPKVRVWNARAYDVQGQLVALCQVLTINRQFARWEARDKLLRELGGTEYYDRVDHLTVSTVRQVVGVR